MTLTNSATHIKWGYALASLDSRPVSLDAAGDRVRLDPSEPPRIGEVVVARVDAIGQHTRIDQPNSTRATLFVGDLVGVAFAPRYATRSFEAVVPSTLEPLHFVCSGGVCGRVVGTPEKLGPPTELTAL